MSMLISILGKEEAESILHGMRNTNTSESCGEGRLSSHTLGDRAGPSHLGHLLLHPSVCASDSVHTACASIKLWGIFINLEDLINIREHKN